MQLLFWNCRVDLFDNPFGYKDGHAWVADGYKTVTSWEKTKIDRGNTGGISYQTGIVKKPAKYLHMNWGWGESYSKQGGSESDGWCTYDYWIGSKYHFKWNKKMITVKP